MEENGWEIFNRSLKDDEKGKYTFTGGRGNTTIDLVIGDEEVRERIWKRVENMEIGDRIDLDHHPVEVKIKVKYGGERKERKKKRKGE